MTSLAQPPCWLCARQSLLAWQCHQAACLSWLPWGRHPLCCSPLTPEAGRWLTPIIGPAADRLAWHASLPRQVLTERRAQCSQTAGDASASWACCGLRHAEHTRLVSALVILLPHVHALADSLPLSIVMKGSGSVLRWLCQKKG